MKGADNERENEVVVLVCCRCALTPKKLSWAYAGATFDSKKLMPSLACNLGPLVFSRLPLGSDRPWGCDLSDFSIQFHIMLQSII